MKRILTCIAAALPLAMYADGTDPSAETGSPENIIPEPLIVEMQEGVFTLPEDGTASYYIEGDAAEALETAPCRKAGGSLHPDRNTRKSPEKSRIAGKDG